jgi:hypothetical protein
MQRALLLLCAVGIFIPIAIISASAGDLKATYEGPPTGLVDPAGPTNPSPTGVEATYNGRVRVFLVEPAGRWVDNHQQFYGNAVLDVPLMENITLYDGEVWYGSVDWDAANSEFMFIFDDNIMAVTAVSTASSVVTDADPPSGYYFPAHYVDMSAEAVPGVLGSHETAPGYTHKVFIEESSAVG